MLAALAVVDEAATAQCLNAKWRGINVIDPPCPRGFLPDLQMPRIYPRAGLVRRSQLHSVTLGQF